MISWSLPPTNVSSFALLLGLCVPAAAQQPGNMPQLGFLSGNSASTISARVGAFRQGLREVGYAEGKNIAIEYRYADGKLDRLNDLAAELVTRKVSVIVTHGDSAIGALNRATKTIPIVSGFRSVLPMSQADSDLSLDDLPVIPGGSVSPHAFLAKKEPTQRQNLITGKTLSILEIHQ